MNILILNSGIGSRLGEIIKDSHKCLLKLDNNGTILSRQLKLLDVFDYNNIIMTTGFNHNIVENYCIDNFKDFSFNFIYNDRYNETNYIYSIYKCRDAIANDDLLLMHGDLVFNKNVLDKVINSKKSVITVSSTKPLPDKDFKAVISNDRISKVGIDCFNNALAAQPLYKIMKDDWKIWLDKIVEFCESGNTNCYAENAFNEVSDKCHIYPLDIKDELCTEIDNVDDLNNVREILKNE